ncbi:hypothetical protein WJX84_001656 [Apatococcus fuscideae]|uniref:Cilia- and flagella-associated protein 251 n=1 Tax=Apatococcus fuscideae TaxID=2026836 RepID=A0AAW1SK72_9CHLO
MPTSAALELSWAFGSSPVSTGLVDLRVAPEQPQGLAYIAAHNLPQLHAHMDFKQRVAAFTVSIFVEDHPEAATGTEDGDIIMWEPFLLFPKASAKGSAGGPLPGPTSGRKARKLGRLHQAPITCLHSLPGLIVSGSTDGNIRIFDTSLRCTAWFEDLNAGGIQCISFSLLPPNLSLKAYDREEATPIPDFTVSTDQGSILSISAASFNDLKARSWQQLLCSPSTQIAALVANPVRREFAVVSSSGNVQVWSTEQKASPVRQCKLEAAETPTSACYSRDGACLALGTNSGAILILDTSRLAILAVLRDAHVKKVRPWRSLPILARAQ